MNETDLLFALALQRIPKIGAVTAKKLIHHFGTPEAVLKSKKSYLLKIDGIGSIMAEQIYNSQYLVDAEAELKFIKDNHILCHYFTEASYPEHLKQCIDGPILLFQSGNINLRNQRIISVVGTRKITNSGKAFCEKLIETLAPFDPIIVSGLAYGTDITAHKAALKHNLQTIACLAHGLNQIYPKVHQTYKSAIEAYGGFYSDFWSSDAFDRNNFLKRNRIIAGISEATIVIESAEKGGSLVTADIANSYNRDVFAVPGRVTDSQSVGCNNLIKRHSAHLLSDPMDIAYLLNWKPENAQNKATQHDLFITLDTDEQTIYKYLKDHPKTPIDLIALNCDIPTYKLAGMLLNMELKGVVRPLPGKQFEAI